MITSTLLFSQNNGDGSGGRINPPGSDPFDDCDPDEDVELVDCSTNINPFSHSVGLNYLFSDDGNPVKINGMATRFRQFTLWHNGGYESRCDSLQELNYPFADNLSETDEFLHCYTYDFGTNFLGSIEDDSPKFNETLFCLQDQCSNPLFNVEAEFPILSVHPAMASSIQNISTNKIYKNGCWIDGQPSGNDRGAIWRKSVPYIINENLNSCDSNYVENLESFIDPNSYRFFAEYLSYYTGFFGTPDSIMPNYFNYTENIAIPNFDGNFKGQGLNEFIELWNEPDAWFTSPNDYGYFTPSELAAMCHAAIGSQIINNMSMPTTETIINYTNIDSTIIDSTIIVEGGIRTYDTSMELISPGLHEMDIDYYNNFMNALDSLRPGFTFDINSFHHYSVYNINDLHTDITVNDILNVSMCHTDSLNPPVTTIYLSDIKNDTIETVCLESEPNNTNAYWICPELDGYVDRGDRLAAGGITGRNWITEWGYPSVSADNFAQYPESLIEGGMRPDEIQSAWLMRGFMEYDRANNIDASFWHWYQDGTGSDWDQVTGIITANGGRKVSWFGLSTLMEQIGDKNFDVALGCSDSEDIPSITINQDSLIGQDPEDCVRLYKYVGECCEDNGIIFENYEESVWVTWFPSMINHAEEVEFNLTEDLRLTGAPLQYYTVQPDRGSFNGIQSDLIDIDYTTSPVVIKVPVSETPTFIRFVGECACDNEEPTEPPSSGTCEFQSNISLIDTTCTSITVQVDLEAISINPTNPCPYSNSSNISIVSIQSGGIEGVLNPTVNSIVNQNIATVTISGLNPGQHYNIILGIGYTAGTELGFINANASGTTQSDCFGNIMITSDSTDLMLDGCDNQNLTIDISGMGIDEANILTLQSTIMNAGGNGSPSIPLIEIPAYDWNVNDDQSFFMDIPLSNLSSDNCYTILVELVDDAGIIYVSQIFNVCTPTDCGGPPIVTDIIADCDQVCFMPVLDSEDNCITEYRLEVADQDGNVDVLFEPEADCDGTFCFNLNELNLGTPPYVAHIRTINNNADNDMSGDGGNSNTALFGVLECCMDKYPAPEVDINSNCYQQYAYVTFCLDYIAQCYEDNSISIQNINATSSGFATISLFNAGDNCFTVQFNSRRKPVCDDIDYEVTVEDNGFNFSFTGTISYEGCCDDETEPSTPTPDDPEGQDPPAEFLEVTNTYNPSNRELFISGELSDLDKLARQSRIIGKPSRYVITKKREGMLNVENYENEIEMILEEESYDGRNLNEKYVIHLLAFNTVYDVLFPENNNNRNNGNPPNFRLEDKENGVNIYPNPTKDDINIESNIPIVSVKITDLFGRSFLKREVNDANFRISTKDINNGTYIFELKLSDGDTFIEKVIVQKE